MLVYQSVKSCACCGNHSKTDSEIVDIPLEEISLQPKAVLCQCGYFYEMHHYAVSFSKWKVAKEMAKHNSIYAIEEISRLNARISEATNENDIELAEKHKASRQYHRRRLIEANKKLKKLSESPIHDEAFDEAAL